MKNNPLLDAAIEYASMGMAVFPLKPRDKKPITAHGVHEATTDFDQITKWWKKNPNANIGIACGQVSGGLTVIDVDRKPNGVDGLDSLNEWERDNGELPETIRSITGSGGCHIIYRSNTKEGNRVNILDGVDIRADGGYIVAPPSIHNNGNQYEWEYDPEEYEIAEVNDTVRKLLQNGKKGKADDFTMPDKIGEGKRNDTIYKLACSLQAKNLPDEAILASCMATNNKMCNPPLKEDEVGKIVESALKHDKGASVIPSAAEDFGLDLLYVTDAKGNTKIRQCAENVARVILGDPNIAGKIKDDTFGHKLIYFGQLDWRKNGDTMGEWSDKDDAALRSYLDIRYNLRNKNDYADGFNMALLENSYDPLVGFLDALEWDGIPRVDTLLTDFLGVEDTEYSREVMRVFLRGAVRRAYDPGAKFDLMPVLIGRQGDGKSTFFKYLACNDEWFNDNFNFRSTDSKTVVEHMTGKWILEMAEMDTMKKDAVTSEAMKAFVSSQADKYRTPFEKRPEDRKRRCVFCGTSNDKNFLKDRTGNRRYLPVDVNKPKATKDIFNEKEARPYFLQAIAEAVHNYKQDPTALPVMPDHLADEAIEKQLEHLEEDPWVVLIENYLEHTNLFRINANIIWEEGFEKPPADLRRAEIGRILTIMRNDIKGWHEIGKARIGGYGNSSICFERDQDESEPIPEGYEAPDDPIPF